MKKISALILTLAMVLSLLAGCTAKTDWDYIKSNGKMVIGITYFAPMNYLGDDGELTGFETEFAKAVCKELGVEAVFQPIDWEAKETELNAKNIDCIWNGMTITDERKETMDISVPYMSNKQVMVTLSENVSKYTTPESVKDVSVVAEKKSAGEEVAKENEFFKDAKYTAVDLQSKVLVELKSKTAQIGVVDYVLSIGSIGEGTDYADLTVVPDVSFNDETYGIAFRKNSPETLEKVNSAINKIANDGTLRTIAEKYKLQDLILVGK